MFREAWVKRLLGEGSLHAWAAAVLCGKLWHRSPLLLRWASSAPRLLCHGSVPEASCTSTVHPARFVWPELANLSWQVPGGWNRERWHEDSAARLDLRSLRPVPRELVSLVDQQRLLQLPQKDGRHFRRRCQRLRASGPSVPMGCCFESNLVSFEL